ncbi:MAG: hypothetical protein JXX29_08400 [Deltaproteobacteria bacterium]|nr:hypothetical protein [Deltaproteobacteria bacterium]MBN2671681.1 hypothetical protein [Deltaproteobacteria bacterium]
MIHQLFGTDAQSSDYLTDTELTDWSYDTADNLGGADQECYTKTVDGARTVWCDTPQIIAQECDEYASSCCCRAPCQPSMCVGNDESVPCSYFDLAESLGYCNLSLDIVPVYYSCSGNCTPRSQCNDYRADGFCRDENSADEGLCLLYESEGELQPYCQLTCEMQFCDSSHMCVPMYNSVGVYSGFGACHPI